MNLFPSNLNQSFSACQYENLLVRTFCFNQLAFLSGWLIKYYDTSLKIYPANSASTNQRTGSFVRTPLVREIALYRYPNMLFQTLSLLQLGSSDPDLPVSRYVLSRLIQHLPRVLIRLEPS